MSLARKFHRRSVLTRGRVCFSSALSARQDPAASLFDDGMPSEDAVMRTMNPLSFIKSKSFHGGRAFSTLNDDIASENIAASNYDRIPSDIEPLVVKFSRKEPTPASLQMLMQTGRGRGDFGSGGYTANPNHSKKAGSVNWGRLGQRLAGERILIQMAGFLRHELPVRLAHRIMDLDQVPLLRDMEAVQNVKGIYVNSFRELTSFSPHIQTKGEENDFANLLTELYQKHAGVLVQMAQGAYQLREEIRQKQKEQRRITFIKVQVNPWRDGKSMGFVTVDEEEERAFERMEGCHRFLDRFYMSRIGIRFLAGQYLSLRRENNTSSINDPQNLSSSISSESASKQHHYIGMICKTTSPHECVRQATTDATMMCRRHYGRCPAVQVSGRLDLTFPYIPAYLHYILLELLKNALRATMDRHVHSEDVPTVEVVIADGTENEDVVIKISDEGGGIPRSQVDKIWSYLFTTADKKVQQSFIGGGSIGSDNKDHSKESPLAGLGYGLPISRSYCRYFGGDLDLISMEGYGTDAFVHLKRLGDSKEPVPV